MIKSLRFKTRFDVIGMSDHKAINISKPTIIPQYLHSYSNYCDTAGPVQLGRQIKSVKKYIKMCILK